MFIVRYVALAGLAVWVGAMTAVLIAGADGATPLRAVHRAGLISGALVLLALFVMKFLGPPPVAFPLRAAVVAVMLAIAAYAGVTPSIDVARTLTAVNVAAGLALLSFYAHET